MIGHYALDVRTPAYASGTTGYVTTAIAWFVYLSLLTAAVVFYGRLALGKTDGEFWNRWLYKIPTTQASKNFLFGVMLVLWLCFVAMTPWVLG